MTGGINDKVDLRSTSTKVADNNTRSIRCACLSLVVALLAAVVILSTAGACVNFAVEIEQLKSETADCHKSYDSAIQELNASLYANRNLDPNLSDFLIWQLSQNITLLNSSIQELKLETADFRKSYDSAIQELNASLYADRNLDLITLLNSSIQELKLETADFRKSYDSAIQELNASLYADRNLDLITLLNSSIQELKLETADCRKSYDSAIQELNASLYADRNLDLITLLNSSIQEL